MECTKLGTWERKTSRKLYLTHDRQLARVRMDLQVEGDESLSLSFSRNNAPHKATQPAFHLFDGAVESLGRTRFFAPNHPFAFIVVLRNGTVVALLNNIRMKTIFVENQATRRARG